MKNHKAVITAVTLLALLGLNLGPALSARTSPIKKTTVKLIPDSTGDDVKVLTAKREAGFLPQPRVIKKRRALAQVPTKTVRPIRVKDDALKALPPTIQQSINDKKSMNTISAKLDKIFLGVAMGALGCDCYSPSLTVFNTTFEPIVAYVYDDAGFFYASQRLFPGESSRFSLSRTGGWSVEVFGEYTNAWLYEGSQDFDCGSDARWYIADPFAAVDVTNFSGRPVMLCANDFYCDRPEGVVDPNLTMEFYFYPGVYEFTFRDAWELNWLIDVLNLTLYSNEVVALDVTSY